jgi:SagB-type dehydrogenase family enzyme
MPDTRRLAQSFVLSFTEGITLHEKPDGNIVLHSSRAEMLLEKPSAGFRKALGALCSDGATEEQLLDLVSGRDASTVSRAAYYLRRLTQHGMLCHTITWSGIRLATLVPLIHSYQEIPGEPGIDARYVMSRFSYLRKDGEQFILESPLAGAKIVLHDSRAMTFLHGVAKACSLSELYGASKDIPRDSAALFVRLLLSCQALFRVGEEGCAAEETLTLSQWDFRDLLFHTSSRLGRHSNPYGATFRFLGKIDPLPAVKVTTSDVAVRLYKPDMLALKEKDTQLTQVLEERRSLRKHGEPSITADQLGEFLYRSARLRVLSEATQDGYERSDRPYPSGGSCYELELYVVVNRCEGLSPGLYHYCPRTHQLYKVADRTHEVEALLQEAYYAADQEGMPQILIILSARFQRVMWKYDGMAYALILKDVGVLYQTMYLVATAMGLAPCALGGGNSDVFAAAAGTDYYAETSVGEFLLGSKAR